MRDGTGFPEVCSEDGGRDDQQGDGGETAAGQQGRVRKQSAYLQQLLLPTGLHGFMHIAREVICLVKMHRNLYL